MNTPWGYAQHTHAIAPGVYEVDTASHGGILVHKNYLSTYLSPAAIAKGWQWGEWYAYEEDCDWAIFAFEQPELYVSNRDVPGYKYPHIASEMKQIARECLQDWHKDYLAQIVEKEEGKQAA